MRPNARIPLTLTLAVCLGLALTACKPQSAQVEPVSVLMSADKAQVVAGEQQSGYQLLSQGKDLSVALQAAQDEPAQQEALQAAVRSMAEKDQTVAILGATSNNATMQAAGLVNFLNLPMLIATAGGDNLTPANNLWAFRLSAPGSAYGRYLFGQVVTKASVGGMKLDANTLETFKIAILYEQNTFGESAAVATAQTAMQQTIEIDAKQSLYGLQIAVYGSFPDSGQDAERIQALVQQAKDNGADLVYLVTSSNDLASQLVRTFVSTYAQDQTPLPILVGAAGAFASQAFEQSTEAKDVTILRQQWDRSSCPASIHSFYAGQSYAAATLLNQTVRFALEAQPKPGLSLSAVRTDPADKLAALRQTLREKLKETQLNLPCMGMVTFDTSGMNQNLQFELIKVDAGAETVVTPAQFLDSLRARVVMAASIP